MLTPGERSAAADRMRSLAAAHAQIEGDTTLSPQGKRERHTAVQAAAEREHRAMLAASDQRSARDLRAAHTRAFGMKGTSSDSVLADRDARQHAASIKNPGAALKALTAAGLRGDTGLETAIAEQAWAHRETDPGGHWAEVLAAYCHGQPGREAALGHYAEVAGDKRDRLSDNLYRHLPRFGGS